MAHKWYTRARKFPQLIGRTPDGSRIIGGPYTYTQVGAGFLTAVLLGQTTWLWAGPDLIFNAAIFIGVVIGVIYLTGQLPPGMRNPLLLVGGALNLVSTGYQVDGRPIPVPTPTVVTATALTVAAPLVEPLAEHPDTVADPPPPPRPQPTAPTRPALSNVQRLLLGEQA